MIDRRSFWVILALTTALILSIGCVAPSPEAARETAEEAVSVAQEEEEAVSARSESQVAGGGTFVGGLFGTIVTIDPHTAIEFSDAIVNPLIWEGLVAMGADGEWKGVLAESWDVSDDGLTWTFHLREGVQFHNGREMTADDVIYSFDRILNENTGATMRAHFSKIESYEALDPYTVKFVLKNGAGTFLSQLGLGVRAAIIAKESVGPDGEITEPVGTGPFKFVEWKPGDEWQAERFNDYWGEVAKIDEVIFKILPDDTVRLTALQTGEVDWVSMIPYDQVVKLQENPSDDIVLELLYESRTLRLNFNHTRPPFDNLQVRKAVAYAVDKEEFNEAVWFGVGNPHNQPFAAGSFLHLDVDDPYRHRDIEQAKALLAEAGYPDGFEFDVNGHPFYRDDWEILQAQLAQAGIQANVEILDSAQWAKRGRELDWDLLVASQSGIYHWDRTFGYFEQESTASWLVGGYQNDTVSELLAEGRNQADLTKAKETYGEILEILQDDVAALFIAGEPNVQAWRSWVKGYDPNPSNTSLVWPGGGLNYVTLEGKQ